MSGHLDKRTLDLYRRRYSQAARRAVRKRAAWRAAGLSHQKLEGRHMRASIIFALAIACCGGCNRYAVESAGSTMTPEEQRFHDARITEMGAGRARAGGGA